jgi:hypothetical protein
MRSTVLLLPLLVIGAFVFAACGDEESSVTNPTPSAAEGLPETRDAAGDPPRDDCRPDGYECHLNPSCDPEYMALPARSCGAGGGYCCVKGALPPPRDASTDG